MSRYHSPFAAAAVAVLPSHDHRPFAYYLSGSSLWMAGMSLYGFLFTWLLVGILDQPADRAGAARSIAELPPLALLLIGGLMGDRLNGRTYLLGMHILMALPPLLIAFVYEQGRLGYWWVVAYGVGMAGVQALSDPARQATLSRVAQFDVQRAVVLMTIATTGVGMLGFYLGGQLETLGLVEVLVIQSALFLLGGLATRMLPDLPSTATQRPRLADALRATWRTTLARNVIGLNFLSSLFNAGAYIIAMPYIVKEVYGGDAAFLAQVMIVFTIGSVGSNVLLYFVMPLLHPGRLFLFMQLTRMVVLGVLIMEPPLWLFYAALVGWGLNMGITTTIVRTTVQELAPAQHRAQVLSVLILSFMVASPVSAYVLGLVIEGFSPLSALVPGVAMSAVIFAIGLFWSGLWQYRSGAADQPR